MHNIPFRRAYIYIAVRYGKSDSKLLARIIDRYFRTFYIRHSFLPKVVEYLKKKTMPMSIIHGKYNEQAFDHFVKECGFEELHDLIEGPHFESLLYNDELRFKVDIMSMCGLRIQDIEQVTRTYNDLIDARVLQVYLENFSDFIGMNYHDKKDFINEFVDSEKQSWLACLENRSKAFIYPLLNIPIAVSRNPMTMVNNVVQIAELKTRQFLADNNEQRLMDYLKLQMKAADQLQKLGAGNEDAAADLLKELSKPDNSPPVKRYTMEELEQLKNKGA